MEIKIDRKEVFDFFEQSGYITKGYYLEDFKASPYGIVLKLKKKQEDEK